MTKFTLPLLKGKNYSSITWHESETLPGVRFAIRRISLSQRIELTSKLHDLLAQHDFLKAGDSADGLTATLRELLAKKLYIEWGLSSIQGLSIDGQSATAASLIEKGPETLSCEIVKAIKAGLELSEEERKNS